MGGIVFFINLKHGWLLATVAGSKQWIYTFFFGGVIIKLLEHTLVWSRKYKYNVFLSVILISALTSCLVYLLHSFKGTPEPFYSTIPTIILAPPGFASLACRFEKKFSNQQIPLTAEEQDTML